MSRTATTVRAGVALAIIGFAAATLGWASAPPDAWCTFDGTWSATGTRQTLPTEGDGAAEIIQISGAVVLTSGTGLSRGFRGEAIGFDDGRGVTVGRAVWTDERGDRIFSELKGGPAQTGRHATGTITGGTGRYAGLQGEYALEWQYVVRAADGTFQGRTSKLEGRYRCREAPE